MSNDDQYWENQEYVEKDLPSGTLFFIHCIETAVVFKLGKHVTNCMNYLVIRCQTLQHIPHQ
jgi:hypothetical protein